VYGGWAVRKVKLKHPLALFVIVLLCSSLTERVLLPQAVATYIVEGYVPVTGSSMAPTIPKGSRVAVDKFTYIWKDPAIGDIVLFALPDDAYGELFHLQDDTYGDRTNIACKRIVAVGGETVQVREGVVHVGGKKREWRGALESQSAPAPRTSTDRRNTDNPAFTFGVYEPYRVPEGHYFAVGDNRWSSADSRWYGAIPRDSLIGRVTKICWPPRFMTNTGSRLDN
jgi:signal peptidase I